MLPRPLNVTDPLERMLAKALTETGITFAHESQDKALTNALDFRLNTNPPIYVEVKAYHSDRTDKQTARAENVIVLQGKASVETFCNLLYNAAGITPSVE